MRKIVSVILTAGKGVRMKSKIPKVLHRVNGIPMVERVLKCVSPFSENVISIYRDKRVKKFLKKFPETKFVYQRRPLGTAHALLQTKKILKNKKLLLLVLPGDAPLITQKIIKKFIQFHKKSASDISILTTKLKNPSGYGRIIKRKNQVLKIVEETDLKGMMKKIKTINSGIYIFPSPEIFAFLKKVKKNPRKGEYYLTDVIEIAGKNLKIRNLNIKDGRFLLGINTKNDLKKANAIAKRQRAGRFYGKFNYSFRNFKS